MLRHRSLNTLLRRLALLGVALYALSPFIASAHREYVPSEAESRFASGFQHDVRHVADAAPPPGPASPHTCGCGGLVLCTRTGKAVAAAATVWGVPAPWSAERIKPLLAKAMPPSPALLLSPPPRAPPLPS